MSFAIRILTPDRCWKTLGTPTGRVLAVAKADAAWRIAVLAGSLCDSPLADDEGRFGWPHIALSRATAISEAEARDLVAARATTLKPARPRF